MCGHCLSGIRLVIPQLYSVCSLGHRTCHSRIGLVTSTVSGFVMLDIDSRLLLDLHVGTLKLSLQQWTCHFVGLRPRFICSVKPILVPDLHVGTVNLSRRDGTRHFEAELNINSGMFLDLHVGTLDPSVQHWTCHFETGRSATPMCAKTRVCFEASGGRRAPEGGAQDLRRWTSIFIRDLAIFKTGCCTTWIPVVTRVQSK